MLLVVEADRFGQYGPIWIVLAATGMRRGEALGLRWQDVDWTKVGRETAENQPDRSR